MTKYVLLISLMVVTAACGRLRDPAEIPFLGIDEGIYAAQLSTGCMRLSIAQGNFNVARRSYGVDADCDGRPDGGQRDAEFVEDVIVMGAGQVTVTSVGPRSFSGIWQQGEVSEPVRFDLQPGARR